MAEASIEVKSEPITKERFDTPEKFFPADYPQVLLHGSSNENAESIHKNGLAFGTLSTNIFDCLDRRFYRNKGGVLIIAKYDPLVYKPNTLEQMESYKYYTVREHTGSGRWIRSSNVDTDGVPNAPTNNWTDRYVDPETFSACLLTESQLEAFLSFDLILKGSEIGVYDEKKVNRTLELIQNAGFSKENIDRLDINDILNAGISESEYFDAEQYLKQQKMAKFMDLPTESFSSWESYEEAIRAKYGTEDKMIEEIVIKNFPFPIKWDWNNFKIRDEDVVCDIAKQLYQVDIVMKVLDIIGGHKERRAVLFPDGDSLKGYQQLKTIKNENKNVLYEKRG